MRTLVTGGAGFIGSHVCEELCSRGHAVHIIDDLSTGLLHNINHLSADFSLIDIRDAFPPGMPRDFDCIIHLAAASSIARSLRDPIVTLGVNVVGTAKVIRYASERVTEPFIVFASSSSVYGLQSTPDPRQEELALHPASPYAVHKLTCEHLLRVSGLPHASLRFFNVYGPRQRADTQYAACIPLFTHAHRSHTPLTIYGDGSQVRDFTYVGDVARAVVDIAEARIAGTYNVGTGHGTSINDIASYFTPASITHAPARPHEVHTSIANVDKLTHVIEWAPSSIAERLPALISKVVQVDYR